MPIGLVASSKGGTSGKGGHMPRPPTPGIARRTVPGRCSPDDEAARLVSSGRPLECVVVVRGLEPPREANRRAGGVRCLSMSSSSVNDVSFGACMAHARAFTQSTMGALNGAAVTSG